jgi:GPH family glycoside/pentoside/hexuronide:cation symporter
MTSSDIGNPDKPYTADNGQIWAWGVGALTYHTLITTFGLVTNIFILGFGLSPILVSWVMTLPRFIDGLVDPYIGHLSDDTHTRWGRRKPFMVVGAVSAAALLVAMWWVRRDWNPWLQFGYLLACTTLFYICWGIYAMAWSAMGYELSDDYNERARVQGVAGLFMTAVLLVNGWLYWLALRPMFGIGSGMPYHRHGIGLAWAFLLRQIRGDSTVRPNEVTGIRCIAAIIAVIAVMAAMVCVFKCKERFANVNPRKQHIPLFPAIKATIRNRPFVILLLQRLMNIFGGRICGGVSTFLVLYYVCRGNKDLSFRVAAIAGTISMVCGFGLMPFMKQFSKLFGKRNALIAGSAVGLGGAVLAPFITLPGHPYLPLIPALLILPLTTIAGTLSDAMLPDICDYDELQCGQRREGLFTAVMAFTNKLEISMAALGTGYVVAWTGYNKDLLAQSATTLSRLWWAALIPNIFFCLAALLIVMRFPLTEAVMAQVRRELDETHATAEQESHANPTLHKPVAAPASTLSAVAR